MPRKAADAPEPLDPLIRHIRGARVILDSDLARVYGVEARALNQAVKRNAERFPSDFAFQLSAEEVSNLRSQFVTGSCQVLGDQNDNSSQFVMSSRRGRIYRPWAFTEHGALMAANVLRSGRAVQMSVYVVRAFVSLREQLAAKADILSRLEKIDEKLLQHDEALLVVWGKIKELMRPRAFSPAGPEATHRFPAVMDPLSLGLPHREPFVFVDDVAALEPGLSAQGEKTFRGDEAFFAGHFPGEPIVPGVILTEALAQIAGIAAAEKDARFLLSAVRVMKFPRAVRPGERIGLSAVKAGGMGGLLSFDVRATVGLDTVAEGQIILSRS